MDALNYYINGVKFQSLCRICACPTSAEKLIPIFEGSETENSFSKKINNVLQMKIFENDSLPQNICCRCSFQISSWYHLKETAYKSINTFKQILEIIESNSITNSPNDTYESSEEDDLKNTILDSIHSGCKSEVIVSNNNCDEVNVKLQEGQERLHSIIEHALRKKIENNAGITKVKSEFPDEQEKSEEPESSNEEKLCSTPAGKRTSSTKLPCRKSSRNKTVISKVPQRSNTFQLTNKKSTRSKSARIKTRTSARIIPKTSAVIKPKTSAVDIVIPEAQYASLLGYMCDSCPMTFTLATKLRSHLKTHQQVNISESKLNGSMDSSNKQHPVVKPTLVPGPHKYPRVCKDCGRKYLVRQSFDKHIRSNVCGSSVDRKRKVISIEKSFPYSRICTKCNAIYHSRQSYWKHLRNNTCKSTKRISCFYPNCPVVVYHNSRMIKHLQLHHWKQSSDDN